MCVSLSDGGHWVTADVTLSGDYYTKLVLTTFVQRHALSTCPTRARPVVPDSEEFLLAKRTTCW